jgi:hypothetical protein
MEGCNVHFTNLLELSIKTMSGVPVVSGAENEPEGQVSLLDVRLSFIMVIR